MKINFKDIDIFIPKEIEIISKTKPISVKNFKSKEIKTAIISEIDNEDIISKKNYISYIDTKNNLNIYTFPNATIREVYSSRTYLISILSLYRTTLFLTIEEKEYIFVANMKHNLLAIYRKDVLIEYCTNLNDESLMIRTIQNYTKKLFVSGVDKTQYKVYSDTKFDTLEVEIFILENSNIAEDIQKSEIIKKNNKFKKLFFKKNNSSIRKKKKKLFSFSFNCIFNINKYYSFWIISL